MNMFHNSNAQSHSGDLSGTPSNSSSSNSFVTNAPDVDAGIVALVSSFMGRDVNFAEQSEEANEIRKVILYQIENLLHLLDMEGTFPPGSKDDSETPDKRFQSIPLGRVTAKGWIKKLDRAWTRNSAISTHLLRFEELYPNWDSDDNYKLARISEMVFHDLYAVLQDLQQLFNEFPDMSDEEELAVEEFELLNPFLTDDEFDLGDGELENNYMVVHEENQFNSSMHQAKIGT
ncbi:hypothetical protein F4814DRAFT_402138 [Daldinia grandis]|nr:hypothetical protein F4814DRAFT_402138 [Daldinia grandis]